MRAEVKTAIRIAVMLLIGYIVYRTLASSWNEIKAEAAALRPSWGGLALASGCVAVGYGVLIAAWRLLLRTWNSPIGALDATRIWFVSSLGKYIPGKVFAIAAMALLAKEAGASPIAAAGSSIIMQLVNLAAGFVVVAVVGAGDLLAPYPLLRMASWLTIAGSVVGLAFGPQLLVWAVRTGTRLVGRPMPEMPVITRSTLMLVFAANVAAWIAYGIGFGIFWSALLGRGGGISLAALAVYTASYLVGYVVLVAPGGIGARETAMIGLLISLHLASPADAALLATTTRLWLTVLEILPGLLFLPGTSLRRRSSMTTPDGPAA